MSDETLETKISFSDEQLRAKIVATLETPNASLSGLAAKIGVNKGVLYRFVKNGEPPSATTRARCMAFLE